MIEAMAGSKRKREFLFFTTTCYAYAVGYLQGDRFLVVMPRSPLTEIVEKFHAQYGLLNETRF